MASFGSLPFLAQRMFNTPLAIAPDKVEVIVAALADRFGITTMFRVSGEQRALSEFDYDDSTPAADDRGYEVVAGVAIVPVVGTLVHKSGFLRP
jgi:hypothetical protein